MGKKGKNSKASQVPGSDNIPSQGQQQLQQRHDPLQGQSQQGGPQGGQQQPQQGGPQGGQQQPQQGGPQGGQQQPQQGGPRGGQQQPQQGGPRGGQQQPQQGGPRGGEQQQQRGGPRGGQQQPQQGGPRGGEQQQQRGGPRGGQQQPQQGGPRGGEQQQRGGPWGGQHPQQGGPRGGEQQQQRGGPWGGKQPQQGGPQGGQQQPQQGGPRGGEQQQQRGGPWGGKQPQQGGPRGGQQQPQQGGPQGGQQQPQQGGPRGGQQQPQQGGPQGGQQQPQQGGPRGREQPQQGGPRGREQQQRGGPWGGKQPQQGGPRGGEQQQQRWGPPQGKQQPDVTGLTTQMQSLDTAGVSEAHSRSPSVASSSRAGASSVKSSGSDHTKTVPKITKEKKVVPEAEKNRLISLIPMRKDPMKGGVSGRPIKVFANMIKILFKSNFSISAIHYDIKFDPDRPKYIKKPSFMALRNAYFPKSWPAFDGRANVYSPGDLPFGDNLTADVVFFDDEWQKDRTVKITMSKVNVIDLSWLKNVRPGYAESERDQTSLQVLDIILRQAPYNRAIMVGRSFFQQPSRSAYDLSDGMELWVGVFQSAVLGWKPYFNVDVAHKAFPKSEDVIEIMKDLCTDRREGRPKELTDNILRFNMDKIEKFFKGLKVIYQLPNQPSSKRTLGVNGLREPAHSAKFSLADGQVTTVDLYFRGSKNYKLRYPNLPCLWVGSKNKSILLPPELCKVAPGVVTNRKLGEEQTRRMIRETATKPEFRKQRIMESFQQIQYNNDPTIKEFGLSLDGTLEEVNARVLDPPKLQYQSKIATVSKGVWRATDKFYNASIIPDNEWTILNLCNRVNENSLHDFAQVLINTGRQNGMTMGKPKPPFEQLRPPARDIRELLGYLQHKKKEGMKLILVVIPNFPPDVYQKVKQVAELKVGMLTQCVKDITVKKVTDRPNDTTAANILLKVNSKLNGINHIISPTTRPSCLRTPSIIFGADVTHPSPDAVDIPSIAAVAASHSQDVFKYNVKIRLQPPREEIIIHLEEIVIEQLKIFESNLKCKPQKILFYRDGVSEGQFPTVMHYELQALRNACKKFGGAAKYEPAITFLVVQKRHHIRLFPSDSRNSDDRNGNVQAGTIVDTGITHPSHIDFYLVSHASIQGTARPTKYRCLWDDNNMSEDEIEQLTYYLCHMFSRCNRSVSYPAPTYYAHLAAFRARALTYGVNIQINNLDQAQLRDLTLQSDLVNNNPMFFV